MKKTVQLMSFLALIAFMIFTSCEKDESEIMVESISVTPNTLEKTEGDAPLKITATVLPKNATNKKVEWTSSNEKVATVVDGMITFKSVGKATITVSAVDKSGKMAICNVTVKAKAISVTGIALDKTELTKEEGETEQLTATITPANATDKTLTWASSDDKIAIVDANGKIATIKEGKTTITVTTKDGSKTAKCELTVKAKTIFVAGVTIDKTEVTKEVGETEQLTAIITPANATDKALTWESSDEEIATVDTNGKVTALKEGKTTIIVITKDGNKIAKSKVIVTNKTPDITIGTQKVNSLEVGQTATLLTITAGSGDYTVTSSDTNKATVTEKNGVITVTPLGKGDVTISIKDNKTGQTKTVKVAVTTKTPDLAINKKDVSLEVGQTTTVNITAGSGDYMVTSSDKEVAIAENEKGLITIAIVKEGNATVTIKDNKTKQTKTIKITATAKTTDLEISREDISLEIGKTTTVNITAGSGDYTVTSSNKEVAVAENENGAITIAVIKKGNATITIKDNKTGQTKTIEVTSKTPDLVVSHSNVVLPVEGPVGRVNITSGSGDYTVTSSNTAVVEVSEKDGIISVYNVSTGKVTITVKDNKTRQTKQIKVTVTGKDLVVTKWVDEDGNDLRAPEESKNAKEAVALEGYVLVKTENDGFGNVTHIFKKSEEQPYIEITTTKAVGETIKLALSAEDKESVWIDLNNNGVKDTNEGDIQFYSDINNLKKEDYKDYTLGSQTIRIYGKVKVFITYYDWNREQKKYIGHHITKLDISNNLELDAFSVSYNELSNLDVSQNTTLKWFRSDFNSLTSLDISKNTQLEKMSCRGNQLSSLDISKNRALKGLDCSENKLTNIDISQNTLLNWLNCRKNQLSNVDISQNMALTWLNCGGNQISNLEVSQNTNLEYLYCSSNQLSNINVSQNTALKELNCDFNQLTNLDVSQNTKLKSLFCRKNQLSSLVLDNPDLIKIECEENQLSSIDVSKDIALVTLGCNNNQLTSLDVSKNPKLMWFWCFKNPNLTCIKVSQEQLDSDYVTTKNYNWQKDETATYNTNCTNGGGTTPSNQSYIEFTTTKAVGETIKLALKADEQDQKDIWIDLNSNGVKDANEGDILFHNNLVKDSDYKAYTLGSQTIRVYGKVKEIHCGRNQLISSLDISHNGALELLSCKVNKLSKLDISQNTELKKLYCQGNQISSLDVSQNTKLEHLLCDDNQISSLDVSQNIYLKSLGCSINQISSLDVSKNTELKSLDCQSNQLSSLDVSQNAKLSNLTCGSNQLSSLDVSKNTNLERFWCENNPNLTCIKVNQEQLDNNTTSGYWGKDKTATYNTNCTNGGGTVTVKGTYPEDQKIFVKGGTFTMGSPDGEGYDDEHPQHQVTVSDFYIGKYEVTNAQYAEFLNDKGTTTEGNEVKGQYGGKEVTWCILYEIEQVNGVFKVKAGKENYPIRKVSWYGARAYAKWVGGRLPTEAEWEYASRGGNQSKGYKYSGSNNIDDVAWYDGNSYYSENNIRQKGTHKVGTKQPNELGIYDMSGNVSEWCNDWYHIRYYSHSPTVNPQGGDGLAGYRVIRGSYFGASPIKKYRVACRAYNGPFYCYSGYGFRVVFKK